MPNIGDKVRAKKIGEKGGDYYIWTACPVCLKERWVNACALKNSTFKGLCRKCFCKGLIGEKNHNWKGGRLKAGEKGEYIKIRLQPDDFFYPMVNKSGYVLEHRLVVAKTLGRCLHLWEIVHHREGFAKDDNRYPETLQLVTDDRHKQISILERTIKKLKEENNELKKQLTKKDTSIQIN